MLVNKVRLAAKTPRLTSWHTLPASGLNFLKFLGLDPAAQQINIGKDQSHKTIVLTTTEHDYKLTGMIRNS